MTAPYGFLAGNEAGHPTRLALQTPARHSCTTTLAGARTKNNTLSQGLTARRHHRSEVPLSHPSNSRSARAMLRGSTSRETFAAMLRRAFPGDSDNERAIRAAPVLGLSERHVRRLLNCEHDAKVREVFAVFALLGFEAALSFLAPKT